MRFARPAFGVAIIGLAIAVAWYLRPVPEVAAQRGSVGDDAPRPVSPDSSESNAVRPPTIAEVPSDAGVPSVPAAAATASAPTPARAPLPGETPVMPIAQLLEGRRDVPPELLEGEREFATEPVDARWAPGAEAKLLGKVAQIPGLALTGLRAECRSTMCRLQLALPKTGSPAPVSNAPGQPNDLASSLGLDPRWFAAIQDGSGAPQMVMYLWREGLATDVRQ